MWKTKAKETVFWYTKSSNMDIWLDFGRKSKHLECGVTEAAQLAGLNHSHRARQSTLCSREGSTN